MSTCISELHRAEVDEGQPPNPPDKVLIAEDDRATAHLLAMALRPLGASIGIVRRGDEVVRAVRAEHPSVLLLDLNMPGRGGVEVLRQLRRDPSLRAVRVLVLSAQAESETESLVRAAGADGFLPKPLDLRTLRARVHGYLEAPR
jgi:DNA-binding response OmpR family regulator